MTLENNKYAHFLDQRNIEYHQVGDNLMICCPFHDDSNPSCGVSIKTGLFNCFSCDARGPFAKLIAEIDGVDIETVAKLLVIDDDSVDDLLDQIERELSFCEGMDEVYRCITIDSFHKKFAPVIGTTMGREYLHGRKLSDSTLERYDIRWGGSKGKWRDRVIIPIFNEIGRLVAFAGRSIHANAVPKTMKFGFKKSSLYGLPILLDFSDKFPTIVIVEGEIDAMYLCQLGIPTVAIMGSKISSFQVALLIRYASKVAICFDGDKVGRESAIKVQAQLSKYLPAVEVRLPSGKDPNDMDERDIKEMFGSFVKYK